jgi:hypothetical protein
MNRLRYIGMNAQRVNNSVTTFNVYMFACDKRIEEALLFGLFFAKYDMS